MPEPCDPRHEAARLYEEARIRRTEGNTTGAFARYRRVLELAEAAGDLAWRADVMVEVGRMYQEAFDLIEARRWYGDALPLLRETGHGAEEADVLYRQGQIERLAGDLDAAERLLSEALQTARETSSAAAEGQARVARGLLLWERKRSEEGIPEIVAGYAQLKQASPADAEAARRHIQEARQRVGAVRYRILLTAAGADPELLA